MKKKVFNIHPYDRKLIFLYSKSMKKMVKTMEKKLGIKLKENYNADGMTFSRYGKIYVLLKAFKDKVYEDGVLVHEIFHATTDCLNQAGIDTDLNQYNQEPFAYLIENLFKRCKKFKDGKASNQP